MPQLSRSIFSQLRHVSTIGKKLLSNSISPMCPHSMVNFGSLAAEIDPVVWGTPANFNGFRVLAALLHCTLCGVEPRASSIFDRTAITLSIVPHSSSFFLLLLSFFPRLISAVGDWMSAILPHMVCLSANLGCRSETCCTRLAENAGHKSLQKVTICAPSYKFVGLYHRN